MTVEPIFTSCAACSYDMTVQLAQDESFTTAPGRVEYLDSLVRRDAGQCPPILASGRSARARWHYHTNPHEIVAALAGSGLPRRSANSESTPRDLCAIPESQPALPMEILSSSDNVSGYAAHNTCTSATAIGWEPCTTPWYTRPK
jgi:hypothetical protein